MGENFDQDDLARLLALEHAFSALALISASNYSYLANIKPSQAVELFRNSIESAMYDSSDTPAEVKELMREHLKRMFDHVAEMSKHADLGAQ